MRLAWTRRARADLEAIFEFILEDRPGAAAGVLDRIEAAAASLADHPGLGRPGRVPGTRELVVSGLPWILPYLTEGDRIVVLRVLHAARRWPGGFEGGGS